MIAGNAFNIKPKNPALLVITDSGRFKEADIAYIKKILAARPALLADFRKQAYQYEQYDNPNADQVETGGNLPGKNKNND